MVEAQRVVAEVVAAAAVVVGAEVAAVVVRVDSLVGLLAQALLPW